MTPLASVPGVRRVRHLLRTYVSEHPAVYLPFARRKYPGPSPEVIGPQTALVIDGYTRSASTFAVYALQLAQEHPVRLAHHLHAPAQLIAAARADVPTLFVLRQPRDALLSQLVREPGVALSDALRAYARFHACLTRYASHFVVGEFDTVTADFGAIVDGLNTRFGLTLARPTSADIEECGAFIAQRGSLSPVLLGFESGTVDKASARRELERLASRDASGRLREAWLPSADRQRAKDELLREWERPRLRGLQRRAQEMYELFAQRAVAARPAAQPAAQERS